MQCNVATKKNRNLIFVEAAYKLIYFHFPYNFSLYFNITRVLVINGEKNTIHAPTIKKKNYIAKKKREREREICM